MTNETTVQPVFLVYGKTGWIGNMVADAIRAKGMTVHFGDGRLEDRASLVADINKYKPTNVINAAGLTGRPNVDWCETHQAEVVRANVIGCLNLADVCHLQGLHMMYFGTGCIFTFDEEHTPDNGNGFKEGDPANFTGSYYSRTKAMIESLLGAYDNVLTLRMRMPIVADLTHPRNFIAKIIKYDKVINIPNSMTVLPELIPLAIEMSCRKLTGIMNFTNPGAMSHNEVFQLYKDYIDPDFAWSNFTVEELMSVISAPRSNNLMDTARLQSEFPDVLPLREALIKHIFAPNAAKKDEVRQAVKEMRGR